MSTLSFNAQITLDRIRALRRSGIPRTFQLEAETKLLRRLRFADMLEVGLALDADSAPPQQTGGSDANSR